MDGRKDGCGVKGSRGKESHRREKESKGKDKIKENIKRTI